MELTLVSVNADDSNDRAIAFVEESARAETLRIAKKLRVTPATVRSKPELYYYGRELAIVEAAYQHSAAKGRAVLVDMLQRYFTEGLESGQS